MAPVTAAAGWRGLSAAGAAACAAMLAAAFWFQFVGGLAPCELCLWQRWPHAAAIALGGLGAAALGWRGAALAAAVAMLGGAALAGFHAGVEQGWWEGFTACAAGSIEGLSTEELLARIAQAPVVRCDEIPWSFAGLSMAAWNGVLSAAIAGLFALSYASSSASQ